ncbi:MAG: peroxiredoxin [Candidatus Latescibacterota bacterium]|jgi:peroxiredoxin
MRVLLKAVWCCVLVLAVGCGQEAEVTQGSGKASSGAVAFPPAQFYQVKDYQGHTVDLRDYQGRIVLLNFWATWCGPCRYEIPDLVKMRADYDPEKVVIIGVSLDQGPEEKVRPLLSKFIDRYSINYPIVLDSSGELVRQFFRRDLSSMAVPMTFVIDQNGQVYKEHVGVPRDSMGKLNPRGALSEDIEVLLSRS